LVTANLHPAPDVARCADQKRFASWTGTAPIKAWPDRPFGIAGRGALGYRWMSHTIHFEGHPDAPYRGPRLPMRGRAGLGAAPCSPIGQPRARAYPRLTEPVGLPHREISMSDKSPRQSMSKKSGKSIKEKRAEKRSKGSEEAISDRIHPTEKK